MAHYRHHEDSGDGVYKDLHLGESMRERIAKTSRQRTMIVLLNETQPLETRFESEG